MGDGQDLKDVRTMAPEEIVETFRSKERPSGLAPRSRPLGVDTKRRIGAADTAPPPPLVEPGPRYVLMRELGRGGMGRVDEVFDTTLGRPVAQKTVLPDAGHAQITMLVAEAQTCAQLEHPAIVPVYELGADETGQPFYTMRSIRGRTLREVLEDNDTPSKEHKTLAQLLNILRQVCLAVDYAHSRGVVHRDLKPDNVIVGEFGEVYVLDWGIAHVMGGSDVRRAAQRDYIAGSPGYMAPEQAMGAAIDGRTDVFALGAMLHELLTGELPFEDSDFQSIQRRSSTRIEAPPSLRNPLVSPAFDTLVVACLEPNPDDRAPSARFVADSIDLYLDGERDKAQRESEAMRYTEEGDAARDAYVSLDRESKRLSDEAEAELAKIPRWEGVVAKDAAWQKQAKARAMAAEGARALARAETAFSRALGRVENQARARRGLAGLYFKQFEDAEEAGDAEAMVQYLDLARAYDDGPLALELSNIGELIVECSHPEATLLLGRYEECGSLLELTNEGAIKMGERLRVDVGSYRVTARLGDRELFAPVLVKRAMTHTLHLELGALATLPKGMRLIPGGPFLAIEDERSLRRVEHTLPDFAIGEYPVTMREYAEFLDELDPEERARRLPSQRDKTPFMLREESGWRVTDACVEGEQARARVSREQELELPVICVSWFDAMAYVSWLAKKTCVAYRLPTSMEWEKASRGVDGRSYPMGRRIDPAFAKLRESRPEASQPEVVGAFGLDVSAAGIRDVAGGVQDWTATEGDRNGPLPPLAAENDAEKHQRQALIRGGSWVLVVLTPALGRGAYRLVDRTAWVGFRVAMDLPHANSSFPVKPMKR